MTSLAEHPPLALAGSGERAQRRWGPALAGLCALLLLAATAEIVLDGAMAHSPLIPKSPGIAGWLAGSGERLGYRVFLLALLAFTGGYVGLLALVGPKALPRLSSRWAIGLVVALHVIVFAGPILLSTDVFSYIAYARMGVEHGLNPYVHGPISIVRDPVYLYVGKSWRHVATAYGPVYTLLSYPLAPLGVKGALWAMKVMALLASAGTLMLSWRCARLRGLDPVFALLAVGANPLYILYGLGGAHNDLLMTFLMMASVAFVLAGRETWAGASVVTGALVKATGAVLLPFMVLSRRRLAPILGAALGVLVGALAAYVAFGVHGVNVVAALNRDAALVSTDSFPTEVAHLFGKPGVFPIDHTLLKVVLGAILLYLMWLTWKGYDWVGASGWALLAIAVTSTWLLAWYTLWSLPLAVVTRDRRLLWATLGVQALFIAHQTSPLFAHVQ
ncbi:MAG TPA: glycosyltransferase family 87 protein [Solirubrobacteraceae bacterium]|nr:glycosyltransferase family 87 protein [Solirubrobacteraceae bacterium]